MESVFIVIMVLTLTCTIQVRGRKHHYPPPEWHWDDWEYEKCPTNDYCSFYSDECNSDKGWEVRCHKCSMFQTCMKDAKNILDSCDDQYVCKEIEPFKQGAGAFSLLIVMGTLVVILSAVLCCMCKKVSSLDDKLGKANNRPVKSNITAVYPANEDSWMYNTRDNNRDIATPPPRYEEHAAFDRLTVRIPPVPTSPPQSMLGQNGQYKNNAPTATAGVHMNHQPTDLSNRNQTDKTR